MMQRRSMCSSSQRQLNATSSRLRGQCVRSCSISGKLRLKCAAAQEVTSPHSVPNADDGSVWESFASNVSGEWEGVTATFNPNGTPQQLPEHYVPGAFREWGVELWDWQSQCSSTVGSANDTRQLRCLLRRLMPTVGCEADAIAFTEEQSGSSSSSSSSIGDGAADSTVLLAARADGSYSTGPPVWPSDESVTTLQIEHCFVLPAAAAGPPQQQQQKFRVKVVQKFRRNWAAGKAWYLADIDLHKERYDGPFTGKRELAGCGGGQAGIAKLPVLEQHELAGQWTTAGASDTAQQLLIVPPAEGKAGTAAPASGVEPPAAASSCVGVSGAVAEGVVLTLLPLGAWSAVAISPEGQLQHAEAGVVVQQGQDSSSSSSVQRMVSVRRFGEQQAAGAASSEVALLTQERQ